MQYGILLLILILSPLRTFAQSAACADPAPVHENGSFEYVDPAKFITVDFPIENCLCNGKWRRVEASKELKGVFQQLQQRIGRSVPVYSCLRGQEAQDEILKRNNCAPRYGDVECSGRIAANVSEHTVGTASDLFIPNYTGEPAQLCHVLDEARRKGNGGRGGVSVYGVDPSGTAAVHFDAKPDWCNWGICEDVLGEGHCKRGKFRKKKAALEDAIAAAKLKESQELLGRLQTQLQELQADCPPDDLKCRDNYQ